MLSKKIVDGCEFVVFDLEWNQPIPGKTYDFDCSTLTGEIIEIGACRYVYNNGDLVCQAVYSADIVPVVYTRLHYHVRKVTHKKNSDLKNGQPFAEAYKGFREFCGPDAILVGWGNSDPAMLKMNLKFFGMDPKLEMQFLDLQPIFSFFAGQKGKQRSVEAAVDFYNIEKKDIFHSATSDAQYTGAVFEEIFRHNKPSEVISAISSSSIDPDIKSEFSLVGNESQNAEGALKLIDGFLSVCPVCGKNLKAEIGKFRIRKSQYALFSCTEHGEIFSRARIKKNKNGMFYASAVLRFATQTDYYLVASKKEEFDKYGSNGAPAEQTEDKNEESDTL